MSFLGFRNSLLALAVLLNAWTAQALTPVTTKTMTKTMTSASTVKPYRRALVLTGGGISPGVALGFVAAAQRNGWTPDVIFMTCGQAVPGAVLNAYPDPYRALNYMKSQEFYDVLQQFNVETTSVLDLSEVFESIQPGIVPHLFGPSVLHAPDRLHASIPGQFNPQNGGPRLVMLAARSEVTPAMVGQMFARKAFAETLITDPQTAKQISTALGPNAQSPIAANFPNSRLYDRLEYATNWTTLDALRASISDPFLMNPAPFNGYYYFTGAVDLTPLELAHGVADEVISMYPDGLFTTYEARAVNGTFGFDANKRLLQNISNTNTYWIDLAGYENYRMEPSVRFLWLNSRIPTSLASFQGKIDEEFNWGYWRMDETMKAKNLGAEKTAHLREPINPKLYGAFNCENANVWQTNGNTYCTDDSWPSCNRRIERETCQPIR